MNNWELLSIESLCINVTSGGTPSRKKPHFYENGTIPWIKTGELRGWYIDDAEEYITQEALANSSAKLFPPETVLMAMYGQGDTITNVAILRKQAATNQACCAMIVDESVCNPHFLLYSLKHNKETLLKLALGASQRNLSGTKIKSFKIKVPPLETQRKIAAVLSAYDDLIENNTRRIKALEEAAQSLYREWFVEFRYPGHEDVPLVESELGMIPQGWEVGRLEDAIILQRGFDLPQSERQEGTVPVYAATGITATHSEAKVRGPGVVTGRSGSIGTVLYIEEDFWPLNTTLWVREFRKATPLFAYYLLGSIDLERYNSGAAVPSLNRNYVHTHPVVLPPSELLQNFDYQLQPMYNLLNILRCKSQILREARDGLLPRLVSGAVSVESLDIV